MNKHLYFKELGEGPTLLFCHGFLLDSKMWEPQVKLLSQHYRCILPDLWDHGQSDHLPKLEYTLEELTEDYAKLIAELKLENFILVGTSVGGMIGAHLALKHSENMAGLVLMNTYVGAEPEASFQRFTYALNALQKLGIVVPELAAATLQGMFCEKSYATIPHIIEAYHKQLLATPKENIPGIVSIGNSIFSRKSLLDQLHLIKIPTLVIVGEDNASRSPQESKEMADRIKNSTLRIIANAGHMANVENPESVNNYLLEFINQVLAAKR